MKYFISLLMMMSSMSAMAADMHGEFFMGSVDENATLERAVVGVSHSQDAYTLNLAGNFAGTPALYAAFLSVKGLLGDGVLAMGYQPLSYAAYSDSKLHSRWLGMGILPDAKDLALTYSGAYSGVGYVLQMHDEKAGDKQQAYSLLAHYAFPNVEVAGAVHYSGASEQWDHNAAAFLHYNNMMVGAELSHSVPKMGDKMDAYALTASYAGLYKSVGLFGQAMSGNAEWKLHNKKNFMVGPTLALAKGINMSALYKHVECQDGAAVVRLSAAF
jgi:hypothetical protein